MDDVVVIKYCDNTSSGERGTTDKRIEDELQFEIERLDIPNVIAKIRDKVYILSNPHSKYYVRQKLSSRSNSRIGSITKTFTGVLTLMLVDKGKISLNDTIDAWVPEIKLAGIITVKMLLNMTSGIPNYSNAPIFDETLYSNPEKYWTIKDIFDIVSTQVRSFLPGQGYEYSNTNYIILQIIIEKVTCLRYIKALEIYILRPFNLDNTIWGRIELPEPYIIGVSTNIEGNEIIKTTNWNPSWAKAAGQLVSNIHDLYSWSKLLGTGKLLKKKTFLKQIYPTTSQFLPNNSNRYYGLGVGFNSGWIYHIGSLPGYTSLIGYLNSSDEAIAILVGTNKSSDGEAPSFDIFETVARIISPGNIPDGSIRHGI